MPDITSQFIALSDPTRRKLFERVAKHGGSVVELTRGLGVTRPAVSQHLAVLKKAGLVVLRKRGRLHFYTLDIRGVQSMQTYLSAMWDHALSQFKQEAEIYHE